MLQLHGVGKRFGENWAVADVSLNIPKGQMVGIIGRSGAGKSTLLRMINRLGDPTIGKIEFGNTDITTLRGRALEAWRARSAMIFQQFNLVGRLDVLTNVMLGRLNSLGLLASLTERFSAEDRAMAIMALDRLDMAQTALQRADTLSGGQQQRVAIARAMVQAPDIILADEPIASLDPRSAAKVMDALARINAEDGITVICNLHTLDTARAYCERIIGMQSGVIVFDDAPSALTTAKAREIYGAEELDEAMTSTSINRRQEAATAA